MSATELEITVDDPARFAAAILSAPSEPLATGSARRGRVAWSAPADLAESLAG